MENLITTDACIGETAGRRHARVRWGRQGLFLLCCLLLAVPAWGEALLWRIVTELPPPVRTALDGSRVLFLEIDFAAPEVLLVPLAQVLPPGQTLDGLLSEAVYRRVLAAMGERGYTPAVVNRLRPWAVAINLAMPPMQSGQFLDLVLYNYAAQRGIRTRGLETVGEQLALFDDLSVDEQRLLLVMMLDEYAEQPAAFEDMLRVYLARDLEGLRRLSDEAFAQLPDDFARDFEAAILTRRNHLMAERAQPALAEGGAFIAVGALHLPGEEGLIRLLEARGYRLVPVH